MRPPEYRHIDRFVYLHVYYKERARYLDGPSKFDPLRQVLISPSAVGRFGAILAPHTHRMRGEILRLMELSESRSR